ncbi:MFS transporter [Catenulispora sp. NF23]|uniref:MFS transporter n=1 Tax=Catenulispora pinistramenti TaxID=2705254 RepID=A0ABS5KJG6_9ACTN|nr:MFS transporter [Catenulispora pinistramenti]MBS2535226.1 MFS transporter [Catenulispora pinistramenti]MBS2546070.1 MFS transporter [Catenulispora pinistramenti]
MTQTLTDSAPRRSLWRHRDFLLLWGGQSVSEIGSSVTVLALPLAAVVLLDASTFQVGLLTAMSTVPFLLVALPAGALVDRAAKHRLMMWCDLGRLLLMASVPLATLPGLHLTYAHLLIVALLAGVLTVFFDVAYQSYLPVLLERDDLMDGNGKLGTTQSFAQFAGPALGGVLIGALGAARALIADAASYGLSALSLSLIRTPEPTPHPSAVPAQNVERRIRDDIKEGLHFVVRHPILRKVVGCTGTSNLFNSMLMAVEIPFMVRVLHLRPAGVGLVLTLVAVGGMAGGILARPLADRFGSARIIWLAPLVLGLPAFLAPLATPGWGVLFYPAGLAFFGMMAVVYNVAQVSYRQAITPHDLLGRMNASVRFLVWGTMPLGALIGGAVGTWLGLRPTLWIAVIGSYTAVAWVLFSPLRRMRDVTDPDVTDPA